MKRLLLALALLAPALAGAQDLSHPWTLRECLEWALDHNLTVKQSELNVAQREIQLNTSKNAYFPNVSGSANESVNFGRGLTEDNTYTTGATTTNTSFSIGAGMNLFDGMARPNNVKLSQLNLDAALADLERARDDIRVAVAKAYVQVVYDYDIVDVAQDQLKLDQAQVERLQAMVENGKASQAELSQQKATLAQSDFTLVQAENNLRNALLDLSQLLDFPNADGFSIVKPDIAVGDHLLAHPEDIYADAVEQRPGVKAEQFRLAGSDLSIKIAKAGWSPTLSLSGGMGTSYYTNTRSPYPQDGFWQQLSHNFSPYVGLSLSVPIFDRFSARNNVRSARLNRELQQITLDKAKQSLYKEIQQAHANALAAEAKYRSASEAATASEDAFVLAQAKYENGKATVTEYNEARTRLAKARSDKAQAACEYLFQSRLLDFYRGSALEL
ncbi:MAG: TolC family protein [Bacteroidales bacterium]|nr:TolC family protein [Bacteroidales bacterium]